MQEVEEELEDDELPDYVPDPLLNADIDENVDVAQVKSTSSVDS